MAPSAYAATLTVDDDKADCPAAGFTSVQAAIDAAAPGDTITICQGKYAEGTGAPGTNAVTITKNDLTLKGAGAGFVTISPKSSGVNFGSILEASPDLRNGVGDIIAVVGTPTQPLTAHISGVTVSGYDPSGRPVAVEAGIAFVDAKGSVKRSHVTNVVTSEGDTAYQLPGGYRGTQPGIGIVQTSRALLAPVDGSRKLEIDRTRVDKYNRVGILIDGAQNDFAPFVASGAVNWGVITASQVIGRTQCSNYAGTGTCVTAAGQITTGPLFGQDGVRVTAGAYASVDSSLITQNMVNGDGAPVRSTTTPQNGATPPSFTPNSTNNQNLILGAGLRFAAARLTQYSTYTGAVIDSKITRSNIVDNSFGALNVTADGITARTGNPNATDQQNPQQLLKAEYNWWGVRNIGVEAVTPPPPINPTVNPPVPENGVNGTAVTETIPGGGPTSNSVDFFPYRSGPQSATPSDPTKPETGGAWPILTAPIPVADNAPQNVTLTAPATADRGATITLTAGGTDDFAIKRVRFADGSTTLGTATLPPYTVQATIPADAACGSTRTYTGVVMDSIGQTASKSATVTVTCPTVNPGPAAPTVAFTAPPATLSTKTSVRFAPTAGAGIRSVELFLGTRKVCSLTSAPFTACDVTPTGADVGRQALRVVVTDQLGSTAQATTNVTVAKFKTSVALKITTKNLSGGKARRTIDGTIKVPANVTKAQACSGKVTLQIKRDGRSVLNQVVTVAKNCTFSRSVTAARKGQSFSVSAKYAGNSVLRTASTTRRFS